MYSTLCTLIVLNLSIWAPMLFSIPALLFLLAIEEMRMVAKHLAFLEGIPSRLRSPPCIA